MYYRVTTYSFDAARRDEFLALADTFRDELMSVWSPGEILRAVRAME